MDAQQLPLDRQAAETLAADGLRLGLVDATNHDALTAWVEADARGFHEGRPESDAIDERARHSHNRVTGVWDASVPEPDVPVATVSSAIADLTVPGGVLESWAISSVTVAPTHRRRGIARALLESELRTAAAAGLPIASLTVSEATIYKRYGFGPATQVADVTIDTKRAGWAGPATSGRLGFVSLATVAETGRDVFDRARAATPGELEIDDLLWGRLVATLGDQDKKSASLRAVRYDDTSGRPQGFVVYKLIEDDNDFTKHTVDIRYLRAATDEAYAALWHYLLELDLVARVTHHVASADEPVLWMIRDPRAAFVHLHDHHWLRILDVTTALEGRRYSAGGALTLRVDDALGFADGVYRLDIADDGSATVTRSDASPEVTMDVATLSALYLGGAKASTLARAGRVTELTDGAVSRFDDAFRADATPYLSFWY